MEKLTENEITILKVLVEYAEKNGDYGTEFIIDDIAKITNKPYKSIQGTCASLCNKRYVNMFYGNSYFDGEVTKLALEMFGKM